MADYEEIDWAITPTEVLNYRSVKFKTNGQWLDVYVCPSCGGGSTQAKHTFAVHREKGYYFCLRTSCGIKGNFWALLKFYGFNPPDHINRSGKKFRGKKNKKTKFIYGRKLQS